jgi:L-lactate dehydrogenase complex protein LldG
MSAVSSSRQGILERVKSATGEVASPKEKLAGAYAAIPRQYVRKGSKAREEVLELMIERLREYDADVVETTPEGLLATIADRLQNSGRKIFVAPEGLPGEWMVPGYNWKLDKGLTQAEVEAAEGVVTASFCGIADSGTITLHHSPTEGRRMLSLLPDWHLCILRSSQVVETLPEYFDRCGKVPVLATYISGPSATADIEMTRIKGVHGPRFLNVILVRDEM